MLFIDNKDSVFCNFFCTIVRELSYISESVFPFQFI